jgi:exodeoxyribonuclease V alpha subunit
MTEAGRPIEADALLATLTRWCDAGWLRRLDLALARWLHRERPQADAAVLLAAALLAHSEGQGHSCLALDGEGIAEPGLDGPPAAQAELRALLDRLGLDEAGWVAALLASGAVDGAAQAATGVAPLVLEGHRLYLRRHWREEQGVAAAVLGRVAALTAADELQPEPAEVRLWLDRLFGPPDGPLDPADITGAAGEPDWQRVACAVALRGRLALITGGPGTGKTYTVARLLALVWALHPAPLGLRIALAAPTGKAAARLKQSIDQALDQLELALPAALDWAALRRSLGTAWTLHKLLGARPDTRRLRHDAQHPLEVDLLVVDEASMVHLEQMAALLQALPARARLLLLGDQDQLASVEAGAVLGDLCSDAAAGGWGRNTAGWVQACTGQALPAALCVPPGQPGAPLAQQTVMLRRSRRFAGAIGTLARAVNAGDAAAAWSVLPPAAALRRAVPDPAGGVGTAGAAGAAGAHVSSMARLADPRIEQLLALALHGREGAAGGYRQALALLRQRPAPGVGVEGAEQHAQWVRQVLRAFDRFRLLCALRQGDWGVAGLNAAVEAASAAGRGDSPRAAVGTGARARLVRRPPGDGDPQRPGAGRLQRRCRAGAAGRAHAPGTGPAGAAAGLVCRRGPAAPCAGQPAGRGGDGLGDDGAQVPGIGVRAHRAGAAAAGQPGAHARAGLHRHHPLATGLHAGGAAAGGVRRSGAAPHPPQQRAGRAVH